MRFHWIDYIILAVIGLSVLTGLFRGFVKEIIALTIWIASFWLAYVYAPTAASWFESYIKNDTARVALAFIAILIAVLICGSLLNALLSTILHRSGLSGTDRLLGAVFGCLRGVLIVGVLILVSKLTLAPEETHTKESYFYPKFKPLVQWMSGFIPPQFLSMDSKSAEPVSKPSSPVDSSR